MEGDDFTAHFTQDRVSRRRFYSFRVVADHLLSPYYWPRWFRRAVLILPPFALVFWFTALIFKVVSSFASEMIGLIYRFWTKPQKSRSYGYYGYGETDRLAKLRLVKKDSPMTSSGSLVLDDVNSRLNAPK